MLACVAAIAVLITGCTAGAGASDGSDRQLPSISEPEPTQAQSSPITERLGGYDEFENWSSGEDAEGLSESLGIRVFEPGQDMRDLGFIGIAQLEEFCVVAFSTTGANLEAGNLSLVVMSRYNIEYEMYAVDVHPGEVPDLLAGQRGVCAGREWREEWGNPMGPALLVA